MFPLDQSPKRHVDFICPFVEGNFRCPEIMSPMRALPSNREKKLFVMMEKPVSPTKNACPRCSLFLKLWKEHVGILGHFRYLNRWLRDKEIREPNPQELL